MGRLSGCEHFRAERIVCDLCRYYDMKTKTIAFIFYSSTTSADWVVNATSNLALKGIMGIYAMGQINKALGRDPTYYLVRCSTLSIITFLRGKNAGDSKQLCTKMANPCPDFRSCYGSIWKHNFVGSIVQPICSEVAWCGYYSAVGESVMCLNSR